MPVPMLTAVENKTGIDFKSTLADHVWMPADAFLTRPVEPQVLLDEIKKLLSNKAEN